MSDCALCRECAGFRGGPFVNPKKARPAFLCKITLGLLKLKRILRGEAMHIISDVMQAYEH